MTTLLEIGVTNAVIATLLAVAVWCLTRFWRQPAVAQLLWALVLVKLVTPPILVVPWKFPSASTIDNPITTAAADAPNTSDISKTNGVPESLTTNRAGRPAPQLTPRAFRATEMKALEVEPVVSHNRESDARADPNSTAKWIEGLMLVWMAGSVVWLLIAVVRLARFHFALRNTSPCPDDVRRLADEAAAKLGVMTRFQLRMTEARVSPFVWPIGRPTIVLSNPLIAELSREEIKTLLTHELAHLRRKDHWLRWFELVVTAVYWWHPVVWWVRRMIERAEEQACDAWVVWAFPDLAKRYASALFKVVQTASQHQQRVPLVASRLGSRGKLKERIEDIMNATWSNQPTLTARVAIAFAVLLALPFSVHAVTAASESNTDSKQQTQSNVSAKPTESETRPSTTNSSASVANDSSKKETDSASGRGEIAAMREYVAFLEDQLKIQQERVRVGSRGGSADKLFITSYELASAQCDLALAEGHRDQAISFAEQAQKSADDALEAVKAAYDAGRTPLDLLLQTARKVSESKQRLARIRGYSDAVQAGVQPTAGNRSDQKHTAAQQETVDSNASVTVAKKMMEQAKLSYDRMKKLADKNIVATSELESAKLDYEVHVAQYEHALRTLKYAQLEVQLAETELQDATARARLGNATEDNFEVKKLKIKLDMAKVKASDLE